jgi:hypothetical protein
MYEACIEFSIQMCVRNSSSVKAMKGNPKHALYIFMQIEKKNIGRKFDVL